MLHNETRKLLVEAYEQTHDAQTVGKCFQVSTGTVYRLSGQMKKIGSVDLQTSQRGRKPALTEEDLQAIDHLIIVQPDITIDGITEKQGLSVSNETVRKAVIGLVMFTKRSPFTRQNGSVFDVVAVRKAWSEMITQCEADRLVFLMESGVNTDLNRRYGRAIGGDQSVGKTPLNTPANTTILSSIGLNSETAYTIYRRGTTREKFLDYLKNTLIPTPHEGDIVVQELWVVSRIPVKIL